jgi:lysine/arginine/ornithine transport system substrate-binding protein
LKEKLDTAIAKVQKDGVVKELSKKYFGDIDVSVK